ncbi:MAG: hypothetical protein DHS20C15_23810 [Planctomycetota bacterium]|nr:MAG: hypothetical protein DHS20C15_23810 [Planctomycetota bacterium]
MTHSTPHALSAQLEILDPGHPQREPLRRHLEEVFGAAFGAQPGHLHDRLLALRDARGGALGMIGASRACDHAQLFVEQYLDVPAEALWSKRLGRRVARDEVVEVGNLAARRAGFGPWLVTALAEHLVANASPLTIFAGTAALRDFFEHMGVTAHDHGRADPQRLGDEAARWGRYYDDDPHVCTVHAADLLHASASLNRRRPQFTPVLHAARGARPWRHSA